MASSLLILREIVVRYGERTALRVPAIDVARGDVLAIIGPNGAGKSTLLRVMGLLQHPSTGVVLFNGEEPGAGNSLHFRRKIATVFQEPLLLNTTVYRNAALGLKLRGLKKAQIDARLTPWLERLGIAHLAQRRAGGLSGGEAQRTSLARALALEPELLLLDEPWAALDPASREELLRDFSLILKETKMTTVFVTHDREEAFALGEQVAVLKDGLLLQSGLCEEIFFRPNSSATAEIVGVANRLPGVVEQAAKDSLLVKIGKELFLRARGGFAVGTKVMLCVRSEAVLLRPRECAGSEWNRVKSRITRISPGISSNRVILDWGGIRLIASIERRDFIDSSYREGDEVIAVVSPTAIHVIAAPEIS